MDFSKDRQYHATHMVLRELISPAPLEQSRATAAY